LDARRRNEHYPSVHSAEDLLHVPKLLEGLKTWLRPMNDVRASDVAVGETPEKPAVASTPVKAGARLQSGAIVGIFALLVFHFLYFASPILIPIITALLLSMQLGWHPLPSARLWRPCPSGRFFLAGCALSRWLRICHPR
jgi:hypothetical protein